MQKMDERKRRKKKKTCTCRKNYERKLNLIPKTIKRKIKEEPTIFFQIYFLSFDYTKRTRVQNGKKVVRLL